MGTLIFPNAALKYNENDTTAIPKHCHQHQNNSCLDNFKVLGNVVRNFHLQLRESLLIQKTKPFLSIVKESMLLCLLDNDY